MIIMIHDDNSNTCNNTIAIESLWRRSKRLCHHHSTLFAFRPRLQLWPKDDMRFCERPSHSALGSGARAVQIKRVTVDLSVAQVGSYQNLCRPSSMIRKNITLRPAMTVMASNGSEIGIVLKREALRTTRNVEI
jgi:hypothetical protein